MATTRFFTIFASRMATSHNIVLICTNDLHGGAAVVTYRLMKALQGLGHHASMLVMHKYGDDPDVHLIGTELGRKVRFMSERAYIMANNGFDRRNLFKVSVANTGYDISRHPLVRQADAIILSWINQGMLSLDDIKKLAATGKPLAWIMHDMWCFTGVCHHAQQCDRYLSHCGNCQYLHGGTHAVDLSTRTQEAKKQLYTAIPGIKMVAVSSWLQDCAKRSYLLNDMDVRCIHNAFPIEDYHFTPTAQPLPETVMTDRRLIIMGAARLDDPIKDLPLAIEALNHLIEIYPEAMTKCQAVFFGELRDPALLERLKLPYVHLGPISNPELLRQLYATSTVVLSTSVFETLPGTIIEGMAAGCTPVATGSGGQRDIITDGVTGYITDHTAAGIAKALSQALKLPLERELQHQAIARKFSSDTIAHSIVELLFK